MAIPTGSAMLHYFAFKNFLSFKERTEVSFVLSQRASSRGWDALAPSGPRVATALAVIGANGAGKTSLIKPVAFLSWFTKHSFLQTAPNEAIPIKPHFATPDEPVEFEIEIDDLEGVLWRYELKATPSRVLHEAVYKRPKKKRAQFSHVFKRSWDEPNMAYSIAQNGFDFDPAEAKKVRPNASLISTAAQYGVASAQHLIGAMVSSNVMQIGRVHPELGFINASAFFHENAAPKQQMETLLQRLDFGLSGVKIRKLDLAPAPDTKLSDGGKPSHHYQVFGVHTLRDGAEVELHMMEESSGTRTAFTQLWYLLGVLANGGVAVIDELESDMHPHMIEPLLDLFASEHTNPHLAQIIFTSHSIEVLSLLGKSQVVLVEKKHGESEAWRLDSMDGVRTQDNLYAKYMSGAYGAVPQL